MKTVKAKVCKVCGSSSIYRSDQEEPKVCTSCRIEFAKVVFVSSSAPPKAYKTHNQVRWGCISCQHRGVIWVKKGEKLAHCPHCEVGGRTLKSTRIEPAGDCETIWQRPTGITRAPIKTRIPKKKKTCLNCGHRHFYLLSHPSRCERCEEPM